MDTLKRRKYVISISQGNYLKCDGGVDKVIAEHANLFNEECVSYIHIAPVKRILMKKPVYTLVIDSHFKGIYELEQLLHMLSCVSKSGNELLGIFIHHLLKCDLRELSTLLECTDAPIAFYIHDYYTICKQFNLLKNGKIFCGSEKPDSIKCYDCAYYGGQEEFIRLVSDFLIKFRERIVVISPSQIALDIWNRTYGTIKLDEIVIPHQKMTEKKRNPNYVQEKIRVAYIGRMIYEKGAEVWEKITQLGNVLELYYYGTSSIVKGCVKKRYVQVDKDNLTAMVDAVKADSINIAVLWSICPETYSYAVYEAISAGCFVLTNCNSGNIAATVQKYCCGKVFDTDKELIEYLSNMDILTKDLFDFSNQKIFCELKINKDILDVFKGNSYTFKSRVKNYYSPLAKLDEMMYRVKYKSLNRM